MNATVTWLASQCQENLLTEKWLLAEDLRIAQQWKDRLNLAGHASINLHSKTLRSLSVSLVGNVLAARKLTFVSGSVSSMIVHGLVSEFLEAGELDYFSQVHSIDGLADLMTKSISDLRLAELDPSSLMVKSFESATENLSEKGSDPLRRAEKTNEIESPPKGQTPFRTGSKARDVKRIYEAYCSRLVERNLADYASCIQLAISGIQDGSVELPKGLLILLPEELKFTLAEQRLLEMIEERSIVNRPNHLPTFSEEAVRLRIHASLETGEANFAYFSGYGEVNEVRGVFPRILSQHGGPHCFDNVEILHTDYHQYVPLILELLSTWLARPVSSKNGDGDGQLPAIDALPVTFAEGIACVYSRPGRALRGWLRWARYDCVQSKAVQLLREGLLARPDSTAEIGYARLASTLRGLPIGFKLERYLPKISEAITSAQQRKAEDLARREKQPAESPNVEPQSDFGIPALEAIQAIMQPLVSLAPQVGESAATVLEKARQFLMDCARADNKLDRHARGKLIDDMNAMLSTLELTTEADLDVWQWLEELPLECRILASGEKPGCMHVAPLVQGGHTGRKHVFIVGLDDGRYPRRAMIDPILLDAERSRLSPGLQTSQESSQHQQQSLARALFRILANAKPKLHFSYSSRNLADDRATYPSSSMLDIYRITERNEDAHRDDLLAHLGSPVSFASENPDEHLDENDVDLATLLSERNAVKRRQMLAVEFPHIERCRIASEMRAAPDLSEYDGWVPAAGVALDPAGGEQRISPSRLEAFGACPRRFFFKYGLGVYPPDESKIDPDKWLDSLQFGNLVHDLLEDFLRGHTEKELIPNFARDHQPLRAMLESKIERLKADIPIQKQDAYLRQVELLGNVCEIFLRKEEEYCQQAGARPWVLEASIGLGDEPRTELDWSEPIALTLSDGRVIRVGGRIDRVDKLMSSGSERYAIWDYKSGSDYGFKQEDPFASGRKLQPFLYVGMLRHRIAAMGGKPDAVESFGYFFPTPRTEGRKLSWTRGELKRGDEVLRHICDLIRSGVFVATTDPADCVFCDYVSVCKNPDFVAAESLKKSLESGNKKVLKPWLELRALDQNAGVSP